jgi:hypothetical protein
MTSIFSMKYESGSSVGGGCVGGLRKKEMVYMVQSSWRWRKIGFLSSVECPLEVLSCESVILSL